MFSVCDTGIGIPPEKVDKIFSAFEQVDTSTTREYGGTGLGLAISSRLVNAMRGDLWVDSIPDEGSTFFFTVTMQPATPPNPSGQETQDATTKPSNSRPVEKNRRSGNGRKANRNEFPPMRQLRILLAEDGKANQTMAVGLLKKWGHVVDVAENGFDVVRLYQSDPFDVILMDVQMPKMDGLAATRTIRDLECESDQHIPIVAMTAHAMKGDRERCLASGMDDYVSKPVKRPELYRVLQSLCTRPAVRD